MEKIKSLLQSCLAILEQGTHFALAEESPDFAVVLLGLNKGMNLLECSRFMLSL
jgi:hypothetical protein